MRLCARAQKCLRLRAMGGVAEGVWRTAEKREGFVLAHARHQLLEVQLKEFPARLARFACEQAAIQDADAVAQIELRAQQELEGAPMQSRRAEPTQRAEQQGAFAAIFDFARLGEQAI